MDWDWNWSQMFRLRTSWCHVKTNVVAGVCQRAKDLAPRSYPEKHKQGSLHIRYDIIYLIWIYTYFILCYYLAKDGKLNQTWDIFRTAQDHIGWQRPHVQTWLNWSAFGNTKWSCKFRYNFKFVSTLILLLVGQNLAIPLVKICAYHTRP